MVLQLWDNLSDKRTGLYYVMSQGSSVGIATGWTAEGSEFESWYGQVFSLLHVLQTGSRAHPASYPMGFGVSFFRGKAAVL
jgi:hypothetical protein